MTGRLEATTKNRNMNIELLRIVLMLMIVTLHYRGQERILESVPHADANYFFVWTLEAFCDVGVNGFVLISGYYLAGSAFKIRKLFVLILQIMTTSVILYFLFTALGFAPITRHDIFGAFFPILTGKYWFVTSYVGLYCLVPFLNMVVKNTTKQQMRVLVLLLMGMFCSWNAFFPFLTSTDTNGGYHVTWLVCLYFFAAYLRFHWDYHFNKYLYLTGFLLCGVFVSWQKWTGNARFLSYISVPITIASILLFLFFKELNIQNHAVNKVIGFISPLTFGVYLISDNVWFRSVLYSKILPSAAPLFESPHLVWFIPVSVIAIFVACMLLEQIRKMIFAPVIKSEGFRKLCDGIANLKFLEGYAADTHDEHS